VEFGAQHQQRTDSVPGSTQRQTPAMNYGHLPVSRRSRSYAVIYVHRPTSPYDDEDTVWLCSDEGRSQQVAKWQGDNNGIWPQQGLGASGVTTRGEVRQLPQGAKKRQGALGGAFGRRIVCFALQSSAEFLKRERS